MCGSKMLNYVLINEYLPGQGIFPHQDGPLFNPLVATISLNAPCILRFVCSVHYFHYLVQIVLFLSTCSFYPHVSTKKLVGSRKATFCVVLQPRSLVIFSQSAYTHFLHGIDEAIHERVPSDLPVINLDAAKVSPGDRIDRSSVARLSVTFRGYAA